MRNVAESTRPKNVGLEPEVNVVVDAMADRLGMNKNVLVNRAMLWMSKRHPDLQSLIVGRGSRLEVELLRLIIRDVIAASEAPPDDKGSVFGGRPPANNGPAGKGKKPLRSE